MMHFENLTNMSRKEPFHIVLYLKCKNNTGKKKTEQRSTRKKWQITSKGKPIRITADCLA
jgi:hypothetical protein